MNQTTTIGRPAPGVTAPASSIVVRRSIHTGQTGWRSLSKASPPLADAAAQRRHHCGSSRGLWIVSLLFAAPAAAQHGAAPDAHVRVFRQAAPAVVIVAAGDGTLNSQGSGFFLDDQGHVLTNHHVLTLPDGRPSPRISIFVRQRDRRTPLTRISVRVVDADPDLDLALLAPLEKGFRPPAWLPLGDSDAVEVGTRTVAVGHPSGGTQWTMTAGIIGGRVDDAGPNGRQHLFQSDTALNPGNSGGPLLTLDGRAIGINTGVVQKGADGSPRTGLNFSVRINVARRWLSAKGLKMPSAPTRPKPAPNEATVNNQPPVRVKPGTTLSEEQVDQLTRELDAAGHDLEAEMNDMLLQRP